MNRASRRHPPKRTNDDLAKSIREAGQTMRLMSLGGLMAKGEIDHDQIESMLLVLDDERLGNLSESMGSVIGIIASIRDRRAARETPAVDYPRCCGHPVDSHSDAGCSVIMMTNGGVECTCSMTQDEIRS